jgi:hypothetical protein
MRLAVTWTPAGGAPAWRAPGARVAASSGARHAAPGMHRRIVRIRPRCRGAAIAALLTLASLSTARVEAQRRLSWSDEFRRADVGLYVSAGTMTAGAILAEALYRPIEPWPGWEPGREDRLAGLLDTRVDARRRMRLAARLLGFAATLQTELVDPAFVVWAGDRNRDVTGQMYALNGLALGTTAFVTALLTPTVRRPRPSYDRCLADPSYDPTCGEADQVRSLIDGRLAIAMTSVALTCTHHANLPLYGARWADRLGCAGGVMLAGTSALLSILVDRQHPTDVLAAVALGLVSGFVLPSIVGYRRFD